MKVKTVIERCAVGCCLLFAVTMSLYHVSFQGFLGLSERSWNVVWGLSNDLFVISLITLVIIKIGGIIGNLMKWVFMPYFLVKIVYHFSCYSGIYFFSPKIWNHIFSLFIIDILLAGLIYIFVTHYER